MGMDFSKSKSSHLLHDVAEKNSALNNVLVVKSISLDRLRDNAENSYLFGMEQADILHTAHGIMRNGFRGAIEVFDLGDGKYEIYSGHIRKYAAIEAGLDQIPCIISRMPDEVTKRRLLIGANLYGRNRVKNSNPILTARQLRYHHDTIVMEGYNGDIRSRLAEDFGISGSQCYKYMKLLDMIEPLQDMVSRTAIPYSAIYTVTAFSEAEQRDIHRMLNERLASKQDTLTREEVKHIIRTVEGEQPLPGQISFVPADLEAEEVMAEAEEISGTSSGSAAPESSSVNTDTSGSTSGGSQQITVKPEAPDRGDAAYPASRGVQATADAAGWEADKELETLLIRLEVKLSQTSEIHWSNPVEIKRVMQSLLAMLQDEIDEVTNCSR